MLTDEMERWLRLNLSRKRKDLAIEIDFEEK